MKPDRPIKYAYKFSIDKPPADTPSKNLTKPEAQGVITDFYGISKDVLKASSKSRNIKLLVNLRYYTPRLPVNH